MLLIDDDDGLSQVTKKVGLRNAVGGDSDPLLQLSWLVWKWPTWKWTNAWTAHLRGGPSQNPLLRPVVAISSADHSRGCV